MDVDIWVFPIRPEYACGILKGTKKYELRGRRLGVKKGSIIVVYATSPIKGILGEFTAGEIIEGSPADVWSKVGKPEYGVTPESRQYIEKGRYAIAIPVIDPKCYAKPVKLGEIKEMSGERLVLQNPRRVKPGEKLYYAIMEARSKGYVDCQGIEAYKQVA